MRAQQSPAGHRDLQLTLTRATASIAIAVVQIALAVSLAALVFPGDLSAALPRAMGAFLLGSLITTVYVGWRSSFPGMMAGAQDTAAVLLAAIVSSAAIGLDEAELVPTLLVLVAVTTIVVGVALLLAGVFRLGNTVRYLPSTVVSGFMAATGWLLVRGALGVMVDSDLGLDDLESFFTWGEMKLWLPGVALALFITIGTFRGWHPVFVSVALVGSVALFFAAAAGFSSVDAVEADGWLLGPFESNASWETLGDDLDEVDWGVIGDNAVAIATVALVSTVGLLLNMSALETITDRDIDLDAELRSAGAANLVGGAVGGTPSYQFLGDTLLARALGATGHISPLIAGGAALVALVAGPDAIGMVPRLVVGGLLAALGLSLLWRWVQTFASPTTSDRLVEASVVGVAAVFGILEAVAVGIVLAAGIFTMRYSRLDPVRRIRTGETIQSHVDRPAKVAAALDTRRSSISIIDLEGYLFFGSVNRVNQALVTIADGHAGPVSHIIINLTRVSGIDASARESLSRSVDRCAASGLDVVVCGVDVELLNFGEGSRVVITDDLDHALEHCEARLLEDECDLDDSTQVSSDHHDELDAFKPLPVETVAAGATLFDQGEQSEDMYVIESGELSVWFHVDGAAPLRIRRVGSHAMVGELGFITGEARSAAVVADVDCAVRRLTRQRLAEMRRTAPAAAAAIESALLLHVSRRLAATNRTVQGLMR